MFHLRFSFKTPMEFFLENNACNLQNIIGLDWYLILRVFMFLIILLNKK